MIKYLGSKRALLDGLVAAVQKELPNGGLVADLFSGTARVGHALKAVGYQIISNDHNAYAQVLATCHVQADLDEMEAPCRKLISALSELPDVDGWFTQSFCRDSRFFQPQNGMRVDAIREAIAEMELEPTMEAVMLTSLMEAADRVDSTTGLQMAYLKKWAPRSHKQLEMRVPLMQPSTADGPSVALGLEAVEAARSPLVAQADLVYLDPPYNQHSYLGNYHVWESLVRWDKPELYGVACKRIDCRERKSGFNSKPQFRTSMHQLLSAIEAPRILVSFSDEGFIDRNRMEELLSEFGEVEVRDREHQRYVGAKIGIHNQSGTRVGEVSHTRNIEYLFLVRR